jgi:hypothetical protein
VLKLLAMSSVDLVAARSFRTALTTTLLRARLVRTLQHYIW